jgi:hypothetical protein
MESPHSGFDDRRHDSSPELASDQLDIHRPETPTRYNPPFRLRKNPIVVLTGLWLVVMILGWLSMSEIISPGADAPLPKTKIARVNQEQNSSLGILGAVAASCALVSVLLSNKIDRR